MTDPRASFGRSTHNPQHPPWIYIVAGAAGLVLFTTFLVGALSMIVSAIGTPSSLSSPGILARNWLLLLLQVNLPQSGVMSSVLSTFNFLDLAIMLVFTVLAISLLLLLIRVSKLWSLIAALLPILGLPVFIATATAGRSALLISALVFSALMFRSPDFGALEAWTGLIASILLFFLGDIATAIFSSSAIVACLLAIGYVTWLAWLFLLSVRLLRDGRSQAVHLVHSTPR